MRAVVMGGVAAAIAVFGGAMAGPSGPNDYKGTIDRSPDAVYAAFSAIEQEGTRPLSLPDTDVAMSQRVTKVPGERLQLEIMVEDDVLLTADVRFKPARGGQATEILAEIDVSQSPFERFIRARGDTVPEGVLDHARIDTMFRAGMQDMVRQVAAGQPLRSPIEIVQSWRQTSMFETAGEEETADPAPPRASARAQVEPRPTVDPDAAAEAYLSGKSPADAGSGDFE